MGVRLTKAMGWGIKYKSESQKVKALNRRWNLVDSNFDFVKFKDEVLKERGKEDSETGKLRLDYFEYPFIHEIEQARKEGKIKDINYYAKDRFRSCMVDDECSGLLLFAPFNCAEEWSQYNNPIACAEYDILRHQNKYSEKQLHVRYIPYAPYPYIGKSAKINDEFIDLNHHQCEMFKLYETIRDESKTKKGKEKWCKADLDKITNKTAEEIGCTVEQLDDGSIFPTIADDLIAMLEVTKIFKDSKDIYKLRPMLVYYWS